MAGINEGSASEQQATALPIASLYDQPLDSDSISAVFGSFDFVKNDFPDLFASGSFQQPRVTGVAHLHPAQSFSSI